MQGLELAFAGKALGALAAFGVGRVGCPAPREVSTYRRATSTGDRTLPLFRRLPSNGRLDGSYKVAPLILEWSPWFVLRGLR